MGLPYSKPISTFAAGVAAGTLASGLALAAALVSKELFLCGLGGRPGKQTRAHNANSTTRATEDDDTAADAKTDGDLGSAAGDSGYDSDSAAGDANANAQPGSVTGAPASSSSSRATPPWVLALPRLAPPTPPPSRHRHAPALDRAVVRLRDLLAGGADVSWAVHSEAADSKVYTAADPAVAMPMVKVVANVGGYTPEELLAAITAIDTKCLWDPRSESHAEISRLSPTDALSFLQIPKQFPVAGRDAVTVTRTLRQFASGSGPDVDPTSSPYEILYLATSVADTLCPPDTSRVRAHVHISAWSIRANPSSSSSSTTTPSAPSCTLTYLVHVDIGGSVPSWVLRLAVSEQSGAPDAMLSWLRAQPDGAPPVYAVPAEGAPEVSGARWDAERARWTAVMQAGDTHGDASDAAATVLIHIPAARVRFAHGVALALDPAPKTPPVRVHAAMLPAHLAVSFTASRSCTEVVALRLAPGERVAVRVERREVATSEVRWGVWCGDAELELVGGGGATAAGSMSVELQDTPDFSSGTASTTSNTSTPSTPSTSTSTSLTPRPRAGALSLVLSGRTLDVRLRLDLRVLAAVVALCLALVAVVVGGRGGVGLAGVIGLEEVGMDGLACGC